jgi:hypothetical protein
VKQAVVSVFIQIKTARTQFDESQLIVSKLSSRGFKVGESHPCSLNNLIVTCLFVDKAAIAKLGESQPCSLNNLIGIFPKIVDQNYDERVG